MSGSFLSLAKVGKCNALWSTAAAAAAAVSAVGLVSYFLKFNGITTGVPPVYAKINFTNTNLTLTSVGCKCRLEGESLLLQSEKWVRNVTAGPA